MENFEDNIEEEYHKRFHDFEEMPDDALWDKIQDRIAPEEDKRPIVFWWNNYQRMSIAASILLGFLLVSYYFSTVYTERKPQGLNKETTKSSLTITKNQANEKERESLSVSKNQKEITNIIEQSIREDNKKVLENTSKEVFEKARLIVKNEREEIGMSQTIKQKTDDVKVEFVIVNQDLKGTANNILSNEIIKEQLVNIAIAGDVKSQNQLEKPHNGILPTIENLTIEPKESISFLSRLSFNENIVLLSPKMTDFQGDFKPLEITTLNSASSDMAFEEAPRRRFAFIPPTEVYANVSPMLSYYVFSPNKVDNIVVNSFNGAADRLGFAAQFGVVYPLSKKLDIRTGLSFMTGKSKISYDLTNNNQKIVKLIDEKNIEVLPIKSVNTESRNWQYMELQSDFLYKIKRLQALSIGVRAGVQTSALNRPVFNGRIGYRISKPVNSRIALWLEPSVAISLSQQKSLQNHFIYRTTGFGLNMGVSLLRNY